MRAKLVIAMVLSTVGLLAGVAAPAQASEHRMKVNEVMTIADGDPLAQFVELRDAADEPFPGTNYELVVYNENGVRVNDHSLSKPGLQATNTSPYYVATPEAVAALGGAPPAQETLTVSLPARGQLCFTRDPGEFRIYCMAYGCMDTVVGGAFAGPTERSPAPREDESVSRQSSGVWTRTPTPTPDAANSAGTSAANCPGAQTFTVNTTSDFNDINEGDGVCDGDSTAGTQCSLKAAIQEANVSSSKDTIEFDSSFDGQPADTIPLNPSVSITEPVTIDGGNCGTLSDPAPCVGIDVGGLAIGLDVQADDVDLHGLAVHGATTGIFATGDDFTIRGSWLGLKVDGSEDVNDNGVYVSGAQSASIGGKAPSDRNVFVNSQNVVLTGADQGKVRGNYIGTLPDGTTLPTTTPATNVQVYGDGGNDATGNTIGASLSDSAKGTPTCDGGCNVIAKASIGVEAGDTAPGAVDTTIKGNFIGLGKNGTEPGLGNTIGVDIGDGPGTVIGGSSGADRNVVSGNGTGIYIAGDNTKVRGSYLGTEPDGTTAVAGTTEQVHIDPAANGTVIGASIDSSHRATAKCDDGCNVIANATNGISDSGTNTTVKGNFVGLDATGNGAAGNTTGLNLDGPGTTVGGDTTAERNFITGGSNGIVAGYLLGLSVKRNYVGLNSAGTADMEPPSGNGISVGSDPADGTLISRNRIAGASSVAINLVGSAARVIRNKVGLDKEGNDLPGPSSLGFYVTASNSTIGEPDAGNTIGNTSSVAIFIQGATSGGDGNKVQGNFIGTDSTGANHSNDGFGIQLERSGNGVDDNVIGGTSRASENVISNSAFDAIRLLDSTGDSTGNQFRRNRGKDNGTDLTGCSGGPCDIFIDLGTDGFGNGGTPVQAGVGAPVISSATRTSISGTVAAPGAKIYIFRTTSAAGASPSRINAFVDTAIATGIGAWSASFPKIPAGQNLTALQNTASPDNNGSELALAVAP